MHHSLRDLIEREGNHQVDSAVERDLSRAPDGELCQISLEERRVIITFDRDFIQEGKHPRTSHYGVIFIRVNPMTRALVRHIFENFLQATDLDEIAGQVIKLTRNNVEVL